PAGRRGTPVDAPGWAAPSFFGCPRFRTGRLGSSSLALDGADSAVGCEVAGAESAPVAATGGLPGAGADGFLSSWVVVVEGAGSSGFAAGSGLAASGRRSFGGPSSSSILGLADVVGFGFGSDPAGRHFPCPNQLLLPTRMASP